MSYEDLYQYTGHMGPLQWAIFALVCFIIIFSMEFMNMIFVGGKMEHWCRLDELLELAVDKQKYIGIPPSTDNPDNGDAAVSYSSCERYDINWTDFSFEELNNWNWSTRATLLNNTKTVPCTGWDYDQSIFLSTIVSRFDLVCGKEYQVELVTTLNILGLLVGTMTSGLLSDRYGRKMALLVYLTVKVVGVALSIFGDNYAIFIIGRFICGIGSCGSALIAFVIVMEFVGPKRQTLVGVFVQVSYPIGVIMQPSLAYFLRDYFWLQIATMAPFVLLIPFIILFIPETPRWLIVRQRYTEAVDVLKRLCKANNRTLPENLDLAIFKETQGTSKNCTSMVRSPGMRKRMLIIDFSLFTCALVYCALTMYMPIGEAFTDSLYLATFISAIVEVPCIIASKYLIDWKWLGRRGTLCLSLIGAGFSSLASSVMIVYGYQVAVVVLALVGKVFISLAYAVVYLYSMEIFPTEVRNIGTASASFIECVGISFAPLFGGQLGTIWLPLPSVIFAACSTLSGLSYLLMPETRNLPLPDTIEQADEIAAAQPTITEYFSRLKRKNAASHGKLPSNDTTKVSQFSTKDDVTPEVLLETKF